MTREQADSGTSRILEAAARTFAEKGFEGARVDEIAAAAGVNKATLYYRIGDKAALYEAVLEQLLEKTARQVTEAMTQAETPVDKVHAYVRAFAESARDHDYFAPIMMREVACGGANLPDAPLRQMGRIVNALDEALSEGVKLGIFRSVNPFVAHMLVVGGLMFFNAGAPIRARIAQSQGLQFRPDARISDDDMTEQLAELVLNALRHS